MTVRTALAAGFVSAIVTALSIGGATAAPLSAPDWSAVFAPDGKVISLNGGVDAVRLEDKVSNGVGVDMSVRQNSAGSPRVDNGTVPAIDDMANGYVWVTTDASGSLLYYAGVERLASSLDTQVEFEFNQGVVRVRAGVPWPIFGARTQGDLLARVKFVAGGLSSAEFLRWDGTSFVPLITAGTDAAVGESYRFGAGAPPMVSVQAQTWDASNQLVQVPAPDSFVEIGLNVAALLGSNVEFTSIQVRTPQDIILDSLQRIGHWGHRGQGGGQQ